MEIILNEREWAESAINSKYLGRHPADTLNRIARYYHQCLGYSKSEVRTKLEEFLIQCEPSAIMVKWSDTLDRAARNADRLKIIEVDSVPITKKELDTVLGVTGVQKQRLVFAMLCVAKYWNAVRAENDGWVNTPDRDVLRLANVVTPQKRQNVMMRELKEEGLVKFSRRVDNLNMQLTYIDKSDEDVVMRISDFRSLGNQLLKYCGGDFITCGQCGIVVRRKSNRQKYCPQCAAEIHVKKSVDSIAHEAELRIAK